MYERLLGAFFCRTPNMGPIKLRNMADAYESLLLNNFFLEFTPRNSLSSPRPQILKLQDKVAPAGARTLRRGMFLPSEHLS